MLYVLGDGPLKSGLEQYVDENDLNKTVRFLGYQTNPYRFVSKCDLFICPSLAEGFSTATAEALILGVPVCSTEVSGAKELLGLHNEYGLVAENTDEALYEGVKKLLDDPDLLAYYKEKAKERGKKFSTQETVKAVEEMLLLLNRKEGCA